MCYAAVPGARVQGLAGLTEVMHEDLLGQRLPVGRIRVPDAQGASRKARGECIDEAFANDDRSEPVASAIEHAQRGRPAFAAQDFERAELVDHQQVAWG